MLFRTRTLAALLLLTMAVLPSTVTARIDVTTLEYRIIQLTNVERQRFNLRPLQQNNALTRAARGHSEEMLQLDYFSHESPTPGRRTMDERLVLAGCTDHHVGENIARYDGYSPDDAVRQVVQDWMNSPGHRKNILHASYNAIGIGVAYDNRSIYITQDFSTH